jgi:L-alanine-DL-glutamate epimerase-like enolase superfamily enzyme
MIRTHLRNSEVKGDNSIISWSMCMKITDLQIDQPGGWLRLITDEGLEGWCPGVEGASAPTLQTLFRDLLIGQEPLNRERLWQAMVARASEAGYTQALWASVDVALWDLLGKALHQPIYRLIGGFRSRVPALYCGPSMTDITEVVQDALRAQGQGFLGYEDRFAGSVVEVVALAAQLRAAVGPDFYLLHDGQRRYTSAEALRVGRALQAQDYDGFASPLGSADLLGLRQLAASLDVPILDGVGGQNALRASAQLVATQAVDMLQIGVPAVGGITDALKLARLAESFGNQCLLEADGALGGFVSAHLLGAIKNAPFFLATQIGRQDGPSCIANSLGIENGYLTLPAGPGLGLDFGAGSV